MGTTTWVVIIAIAVVLVLVVLFARGSWAGIQNAFVAVWNSTVGRHVVVITALIIVLQVIAFSARFSAEDKAEDWLTQYNGKLATEAVGGIKADVSTIFSGPSSSPSPTPTPSPSPSPSPEPSPSPSPSPAADGAATTPGTRTNTTVAPTTLTPTPSPTPNASETRRLKEQLQIIRDRGKHHGDVMAFFYVNYYVAIVLVMTAGMLVAITLFFIAQAGWTGSNSYVRAAFIVGSAYVAFYGLFPPVFQQQKNIADNRELFLRYKSLENELNSYPLTLLTLKGAPAEPRHFINHIDAELDRLGNIALGFDITKVSYEDAFQTTRPTPAPTATPPGQNTITNSR
ncbi:MAG TPA: hypothetical protein VJT15_05235 [Pyrinomonadaceae bacterium]|nr:hypothetical protein [Pyrinomonadaceae bacterium]